MSSIDIHIIMRVNLKVNKLPSGVFTLMSITDVTAKNAKPQEKLYKIPDGNGMFLSVRPNGGKYWQMNYRFAGKGKTLSFGIYPEVTIKEARDKREAARKLLREGIDP